MAYDAFDLGGKVAVVTGGNGGIGLGFAKAVAAAGADVSIWGTNPEKNAAAEKELKEINPSASATICDVSNESAVEEAMAGVIERYGRVDACFPNRGHRHAEPEAVLRALERGLVQRHRREPPRRLLHATRRDPADGGAGRGRHPRA